MHKLREQSTSIYKAFKKPWAHEHEPVKGLLDAVQAVKPTVLIGTSGVGRTFSKEVIEAMVFYNEKPIILALSNPTSHSECTAEEAYSWTKGKAIFASGSPFAPVEYEGQVFYPGQTSSVEIERACSNVDQSVVENIAISAAPEDGGPEILVMFAVLKEGYSSKPEDLQKKFTRAIQANLNPLFKVSLVRIVPEIPRTSSNKLMRRVLRDQVKTELSVRSKI